MEYCKKCGHAKDNHWFASTKQDYEPCLVCTCGNYEALPDRGDTYRARALALRRQAQRWRRMARRYQNEADELFSKLSPYYKND